MRQTAKMPRLVGPILLLSYSIGPIAVMLGLGLELKNSGFYLGLAGQVLALALADVVKLQYINSNIQLFGLTTIAHH